MRPAAAAASSHSPAPCCSARLSPMYARASASCAELLSYRRTVQPARANTIAHARPMRPAPIIAAVLFILMCPSLHPQYASAQIEVIAQCLHRPVMDDAASLENVRLIRQREHQIEILLHDDDR